MKNRAPAIGPVSHLRFPVSNSKPRHPSGPKPERREGSVAVRYRRNTHTRRAIPLRARPGSRSSILISDSSDQRPSCLPTAHAPRLRPQRRRLLSVVRHTADPLSCTDQPDGGGRVHRAPPGHRRQAQR
jgi:hypothetical protein